jgi:excisionase family DNA binding protein
MDNPKLTLTVREAATALGISRGLAYEMVKTGKIPSIRFGKRVLVPQRALERLLESPDKSDWNRG